MSALGWVNIQSENSSIIGADNGVLVKVEGQVVSGSAFMAVDSTAQKLTITSTASSATALNITGEVTSSAVSATNVTATTEVFVGSDSRTLGDMGQISGGGNSLTLSGNEVVPPDFRAQVYGPISVSSSANLVISDGAVIAIRPESDFPAILQP